MRLFPSILLAIALLCSGCTATAPVATRSTAAATDAGPIVILVSIDGFRPDYLDRHETPALSALAASGVRAQAMKPSFPTLTFPNHYTLVTGLYPDHHGIVNNRFVDPKTGAAFVYKNRDAISDPAWWGGEPIWVSAEKQDVRTATMFWPGADVAIAGVRPSHWLYFDITMTSDERVDHLLRWMDLPTAQRARFYTLYFDQVDHESHSHGPASKEVDVALREVDAAIARLVAGLRARGIYDDTDIVIVSDHGGVEAQKSLRTYLDDIVPLADVKVDNYGILATITPLKGKETEVETALLAPHPHMTCWRKQDVPARLHYGSNPRLPPLLCLAALGGNITQHEYENKGGHFSAGEHGYDNDEPSMQALFLASGPDFRRGLVVPPFDNVDVYPLLAHLLRITPQPNDGDYSAVAPMLRDARR